MFRVKILKTPNIILLKSVNKTLETVKCPLSSVLKFAYLAIRASYLYQKSDRNGRFLKAKTIFSNF